jgi:GTP-binding protein
VTIPPQQLDIQLLEWLRDRDRNFLVIATKADRISGNQLRTSIHKLCDQLQIPVERIIPFSSKARLGHEELWRAIRHAAKLEEPAA